uniref:Uncharacterized protein n=1 Tax=Setaria italica TaxID=4555 RepID=K3XZY6_SETIT
MDLHARATSSGPGVARVEMANKAMAEVLKLRAMETGKAPQVQFEQEAAAAGERRTARTSTNEGSNDWCFFLGTSSPVKYSKLEQFLATYTLVLTSKMHGAAVCFLSTSELLNLRKTLIVTSFAMPYSRVDA